MPGASAAKIMRPVSVASWRPITSAPIKRTDQVLGITYLGRRRKTSLAEHLGNQRWRMQDFLSERRVRGDHPRRYQIARKRPGELQGPSKRSKRRRMLPETLLLIARPHLTPWRRLRDWR